MRPFSIFISIISILLCQIGIAQDNAIKDPQSPYSFQENKGQWPESVIAKTETEGGIIYFEKNQLHYQIVDFPDAHLHDLSDEEKVIKGHNFNARFLGSNKRIGIEKEGASSFHHNYLLGNDPSKWGKRAKSYQIMTYKDLYDGVNLRLYTKKGQIKYDYIIQPNESVDQIKVKYEGDIELKLENGNLNIIHSIGKVQLMKPYAYQMIDGNEVEVACNFILKGNTLSYDLPKGYDQEKVLIVDPEIVFFTFTGSISANFGMTATDDSLGNGYTAGVVFSGAGYDITTGAYSTAFSGGTVDVAISKFSPDGSTLLYGTYLGGSGNETAHSLVVDASNDSLNLFILGATSSNNFPMGIGAFKNSKSTGVTTQTEIYLFSGGADIFISKLDSSGSNLLGSTYFGGSEADGLNNFDNNGTYGGLLYNYGDSHRGEIIIDPQGNCLIATASRSGSLPQSLNSYNGNQDGLIAKFNRNLRSLSWTRYLGGSQSDAIYSIKLLDSNKIVVGGGTTSFSDFPSTSGTVQPNDSGGRADGFISLLSADGTTLEYSTFIGTPNYDQVYFVDFDRFNNIYAFGQSEGGDFPLKKVDNVPNFAADTGAGQFFVKLTPKLDSVIFSVTFGDGLGNGTINIVPTAFLVDRCQNVFAAGWGGSIRNFGTNREGLKVLPSTMPISAGAYQATTDNSDFYFYVLNRDAQEVYYATYFGKSGESDHVDGGTSRFDKDGVVYQSLCAACGGNRTNYAPGQQNVHSPNRPVTGSSNKCSNALLKFDMSLEPEAKFFLDTNDLCLIPGDTVFVRVIDSSFRADRYNWNFFGNTVNGPLTGGDTILAITSPGTYKITQNITDTICLLNDSNELTFNVYPDDIILNGSLDTLICFGDSLVLDAKDNGNANEFLWSNDPLFNNVLALTSVSAYKIGLQPGIDTFYVRAGNNFTLACKKVDTFIVEYVQVQYQSSISEDTICENTQVQLSAIISNVDKFVWDFGNGVRDSSSLTPSPSYQSPGGYTIQLIVENNSCNTKDTLITPLDVQNNDIQIVPIADTLVCRSTSVTLNQLAIGDIDSYLWSSNSTFLDTLNNYPIGREISIVQNGVDTFYVKVSNQYCERKDTIVVELVPFQLQLSSLPDSVCTPFADQLSTTMIGVDSFRINLGNGISTTTNQNPVVLYNTDGLYNVELIGYNNRCMIADTLIESIRVFEGVDLNYLNDTVICKDDNIQLRIKHNQSASSFIWSANADFSDPLNSITDSILNIQPSDFQTLYYKGINGICEADSSLTIGINDVVVDLDDFASVCFEDTIFLTASPQSNAPPFSYIWSPASGIISGQGTPSIAVSPSSDIRYFLTVSDNLLCEDTSSTLVEVSIPRFNTGQIVSTLDTVYKGQSLQLSTNRNLSGLGYEWEPAEYLNDPFSASPLATFPTATTFYVTITDQQTGCELVLSKRFGIFEINCDEPDIFIPSAFTPNGDGNNDMLFVRGVVLDEIELSIYNRWGEKVFETNSIDKGWDGTYKGLPADQGVFVYHLKAKCFDRQEFTKKGNVTLIR